MDITQETLFNPYVVIYLVSIIVLQAAYGLHLKNKRERIADQRAKQGLPPEVLMDHAERLATRKKEALIQSVLLLGSVLVIPFLLLWVAPEGEDLIGLATAFAVLLLWMLLTGTDVAKAFLGGLAFKTLVAVKAPFQIGDRVTLKGIGGKVIGFDIFFVKLQTSNDDLISIPTASLWNEVLTSANAGDRASLCVMDFYLAPSVSAEQRQFAENTIWDAVQASVYFDFSRSLQIYLRQNPHSIQLTAKAYVASTYNEPLFVSDVTRAFLNAALEEEIPLAIPVRQIPADH